MHLYESKIFPKNSTKCKTKWSFSWLFIPVWGIFQWICYSWKLHLLKFLKQWYIFWVLFLETFFSFINYFPEQIESLGVNCFYNWKNLKLIEIPKSIKLISIVCFSVNLSLLSNQLSWNSWIFGIGLFLWLILFLFFSHSF
jgi:hypothetical protein